MANTKPSDAFHGDVQSSAASENYFRRVELAAAYRAMEYYGMHGGGDTHITALAPAADNSGRELMLVVPEGLHWSQVIQMNAVNIFVIVTARLSQVFECFLKNFNHIFDQLW